MTWFSDYQKAVDKRQEFLVKGIPTLIPFVGFPRLSAIVPGIIPSDNVIVTAETGGAKSRFTRKVFIKDMINYGKKHGMEVKIFLNSLEEPITKVVSSFLATEIHEKYNLDIGYYTLNNFGETPMTKDVYQKILDCQPKVDDLQKYLEITQIPNPYGFYVHVLEWLFANGEFFKDTKKIDYADVKANSNNWDTYIPNNPNQIVIAIQDTIDAAIQESGKTQYQTILDYTKFFARTLLGLRCGVINVWVQQQSPELERIQTNLRGDSILEKVKPGLDTLLACKATQQSATLVFGLFDPMKYGETYYEDYDLERLKGEYRSLILLKAREGTRRKGTEIPMTTFLGRDEFIELPRTDDPLLQKFYR